MTLSWDACRYLALVARCGSVASAAREAGVSHATILRALHRLEHELGLRLFDHLRTGYRLTPAGAELLPHAERMAEEARLILRRAQGQGDVPAGEISVAVPEASMVDLMPVLAAFGHTWPAVTVNLDNTAVSMPQDLLDRDIRVVFLVTDSPPEALAGRKLGTVTFCPAAAGEPRAWIDWPGLSRILEPQTISRLRGNLHRRLPTFRVSGHTEAANAAQAGMGAAVLSQQATTAGGLAPLSTATAEVGLWLLTHPEFRSDSRVRALMTFVAEHWPRS